MKKFGKSSTTGPRPACGVTGREPAGGRGGTTVAGAKALRVGITSITGMTEVARAQSQVSVPGRTGQTE